MKQLIRLTDIALSTAILVVLSPIMMLLALIIKVDSAFGPTFCVVERTTPAGVRLLLRYCISNSPHFGKIMRRFSVDTLPELINVLMGDLSLFDKQRRISLS